MDLIEAMKIRAVWNRGQIVTNFDPNLWRKDEYGNWINFNDYGNRDSDYGWEMDHIFPAGHGGSGSIANLRPLQWKSNVQRNRQLK